MAPAMFFSQYNSAGLLPPILCMYKKPLTHPKASVAADCMPGTHLLRTLPGGVLHTHMCHRTDGQASDRVHPVVRPGMREGTLGGTLEGGDGGLSPDGIFHPL